GNAGDAPDASQPVSVPLNVSLVGCGVPPSGGLAVTDPMNVLHVTDAADVSYVVDDADAPGAKKMADDSKTAAPTRENFRCNIHPPECELPGPPRGVWTMAVLGDPMAKSNSSGARTCSSR